MDNLNTPDPRVEQRGRMVRLMWFTVLIGVGLVIIFGVADGAKVVHSMIFDKDEATLRQVRKNLEKDVITPDTDQPPLVQENSVTHVNTITTYNAEYGATEESLEAWYEELKRIDQEYRERVLRDQQKLQETVTDYTNAPDTFYHPEAFTMKTLRNQPSWFPDNLHITIDDGPMITNNALPGILAVLDEYQVKATFFIVGKHVADNLGWEPEKTEFYLKKIIADGHDIGYHSYYHYHFGSRTEPRLEWLDEDAILADIERTRALIADVIDQPNFRFSVGRMPGGSGTFDDHVIQTFAKAGIEAPKYWHIETAPWENAVRKNVETYVHNLLNISRDYIILLHEHPWTGHDLGVFFEHLRAMNSQ